MKNENCDVLGMEEMKKPFSGTYTVNKRKQTIQESMLALLEVYGCR